MNHELAMKVANAVLYEGYMLYPYRPSAIKNRQRWSFGILYPPAYHEVAAGTERAQMHSECLVKITSDATIRIQLRFLHLVTCEVAQKIASGFEHVSSLVVDGRFIAGTEESVERSVECELALQEISRQEFLFTFPGSSEAELLRDAAGEVVGEIRRNQREVDGTISVSTSPVHDDILKLSIDITNTSVFMGDAGDRDAALLSSLFSAHTILSLTGGEFISLLDPPGDLRDAVSQCHNVGNFPVLVGTEGERDMMLCSPIVLYDYPQIAPESAGDFFDGTEMDEMLTLRVMTLTDDEKAEVLSAGDHARNLLQRTEASAREQLMRTHGTIRSLRPIGENE
jgi:hypothetical protein